MVGTSIEPADRTRGQRSAEEDVSTYPRHIEVRGAPQSLTWPDICVNCAAGATERIRIRRAFYRTSRYQRYAGALGYKVVTADLPVCSSCAARHRETVPHPSWFHRYRWWVLNPSHVATIGCAVLLMAFWPTAPIPGGPMATWGLPALAASGIAWMVCYTWWISRPDRFEPPSEVTSACKISHDVSLFFEGRRHIFGFRNTVFADAFERANQARVWTGRDQARMWTKSLVATILLIVVLGGARLLLWYYEGR
jgi:hypothetical protein